MQQRGRLDVMPPLKKGVHYTLRIFFVGPWAKDNVWKIVHILIWVHGIRKEALHGFLRSSRRIFREDEFVPHLSLEKLAVLRWREKFQKASKC